MRVLGVDPGFANVGVMLIEHLRIGSRAEFASAILTKAGAKKRSLRQESDDTRRLEQIRNEFSRMLDETKPEIVAIERVPRLRNGKTTRQCALGWSVCWTMARERGLPVLVYEPEDIKYEITGDRQASKEEMVKALKGRFPTFDQWPDTKTVEHIADAGGCGILARRDPLVEALLLRSA